MVFQRLLYILQRVILRVADGLAPLVAAFLAGNLNCDMAEPTVGLCAVPVLNTCRNIDAVTWIHFYSFFTFFLIISSSGNTYQDLSTATFCVMNMPVISALNWTTPSQSPGFTGLNAIQNCIFCTLFDEVLLLSIFPFLQHPILLLPD